MKYLRYFFLVLGCLMALSSYAAGGEPPDTDMRVMRVAGTTDVIRGEAWSAIHGVGDRLDVCTKWLNDKKEPAMSCVKVTVTGTFEPGGPTDSTLLVSKRDANILRVSPKVRFADVVFITNKDPL